MHQKWADYASGSGTPTLRFSYVVEAADMDDNGIFIEANELELNGGTILGTAGGLAATLTYTGPGQQDGHKVDGSETDEQLAPSNLTATLENGDVRLNWNAPVDDAASVDGYTIFRAHPQLTPPAPLSIYISNTGNTDTTFLDTAPVAGTRNTYRVAARRSGAGSERSSFAVVDMPPPSALSVAVTSNPGDDDTYAIGDTVTATVTFDQEVDIAGTPQLELDFAGTAKAATCATATNTTTMACSYTVLAGDTAPNGVAIAANTLTGGTIYATESTTITAGLNYSAVAIDPGHKVDGIRPTLESATVDPDGTVITLVFDEPYDFAGASDVTVAPFSVTADGSTVDVGALGVVMEPGSVYRRFELRTLSPRHHVRSGRHRQLHRPHHRRRHHCRPPGRGRQRRRLVHHRLGRRPRRRQQRAGGRDAGDGPDD